MKKPYLDSYDREYLKKETPQGKTFVGLCMQLTKALMLVFRPKVLKEILKNMIWIFVCFSFFVCLHEFCEKLELYQVFFIALMFMILMYFLAITIDNLIEYFFKKLP